MAKAFCLDYSRRPIEGYTRRAQKYFRKYIKEVSYFPPLSDMSNTPGININPTGNVFNCIFDCCECDTPSSMRIDNVVQERHDLSLFEYSEDSKD